eukprot:snap_masked-scaffold_48-processed-gene-1.56-mRNA-1 protein AED:1.00 eAED:1.00 QI:0/0/0/0/1/1/2/0/419
MESFYTLQQRGSWTTFQPRVLSGSSAPAPNENRMDSTIDLGSKALQRGNHRVMLVYIGLASLGVLVSMVGYFLGGVSRSNGSTSASELNLDDPLCVEFPTIDDTYPDSMRRLLKRVFGFKFEEPGRISFEDMYIPRIPGAAVGTTENRNATTLIFKNNGLAEISNSFTRGAVENLTDLFESVQRIVIEDDWLQELKNDTFDVFVNLKTLSLRNNKLTKFSSKVLSGSGKLQSLDLSNNYGVELEINSASLDGLESLSIVNDNYKRIKQSLDNKSVGNKLKGVSTLEYGINSESTLDTDLLNNIYFPGLTSLILHGKKVKKIPDTFLQGLKDKIENINFVNMEKIARFPLVLKNFTHLKNFSVPNVIEFPDGIFKTLTQLETLNVSQDVLVKDGTVEDFKNRMELREETRAFQKRAKKNY